MFFACLQNVGHVSVGQRPEFLGHDRAGSQFILAETSQSLQSIAGEKDDFESLIEGVQGSVDGEFVGSAIHIFHRLPVGAFKKDASGKHRWNPT